MGVDARILVDTSVWVDALRGRDATTVAAVRELLLEDRVVTCDVVVAELRAGLRRSERVRVLGLFGGLPRLAVDSRDWLEAGDLGAQLRAGGVTLPLTDLLIARVCLRHGHALFTSDEHFKRIPGLAFFAPLAAAR
jgi:predicted nucleic acid-binding protein